MRACGLFALFLAIGLAIAGCGHTDEEMAQKQREIDKLAADLKAAKEQIAADAEKYKAAQNDLEALNEKLRAAGLAHKEEADKLKQALLEYKQRADQLAVIEQRFRDLKARLDKLNQIGLKVVVRNNRMVIQLPGDILFDSGKDELKAQGKDVLGQVAEVIRNDRELNNRYFLVAGHTDNQPYPAGGPFHDNWGLSLARARQVLLFLITPNTPPKPGQKGAVGGGLNPKKWAAAGYGETDPQAGTMETQSKDEMQRNRRVELVVQPNVEEMLNLGTLNK
jgi:chemotaxis protein MotB